MRSVFLLACVGCVFSQAREALVAPLGTSVVSVSVGVGPGDTFSVSVYGESDISGEYRVSADGTIRFPLLGTVVVLDLTPTQVADVLAEKLKPLLKNPQVNVTLKEYNSKKVFVLGFVSKPGTFPYEEGMTILQAITLAGGFAQYADRDTTYITRTHEGKEQRLKVDVSAIGEGRTANVGLQPGDIVYVPDSAL